MSAAITAAVIVAGAGAYTANRAGRAGRDAANTQAGAAGAATAEQRRQFDYVQRLMQPYVNAGNNALRDQQALTGTLGTARQRNAIAAVEQSPAFQARIAQGENAILQNASATGGLRGGNTQAALAQFRPSMLGQAIQERMSALSTLSANGQNAGAGLGAQAMSMASQIGANLQQGGAAQAGGILAGQRANSQVVNSLAGGVGGALAAYMQPQQQQQVTPVGGGTGYTSPTWRADGGMGGSI